MLQQSTLTPTTRKQMCHEQLDMTLAMISILSLHWNILFHFYLIMPWATLRVIPSLEALLQPCLETICTLGAGLA